MKSIILNDIENTNTNEYNIVNIANKYILKHNNEEFIIDSEMTFNNCEIYLQKSKIKINLNNINHQVFMDKITYLYDIISDLFEKEDVIVSIVINPIYKINNLQMLFSAINTKTIIKNIENDKLMKIDDLNNKKFDLYPIFNSPIINIYDEKIYVNFSFHSIYIKLIKDNELINYDKIKKIMNKNYQV